MKTFKQYLKETTSVDVEAQRRQDFEREAMNTPGRSGYKPSDIDDPNAPDPTDKEREVAKRKYEERQAQLTNQVQAEEEMKNPGSMERLEQAKKREDEAKTQQRLVDALFPSQMTKYFKPLDNFRNSLEGQAVTDQVSAQMDIINNPVHRESDTRR